MWILKHKYKFLSLLLLLALLWWGWNLFMTRGGELMFDMKEINGVADNNPYGIRNDVYDYITKEFNENLKKHPEFNDPAVKNLYYNAVKFDLMEIKYFSNKELALEIGYQNSMLLRCVGYYYNGKKGFGKFEEYFFARIGHMGSLSEYEKVVYKTQDHQLIRDIVNSYFNGKVVPGEGRNTLKNPWLCDKYKNNILTEEEILTPHSSK